MPKQVKPPPAKRGRKTIRTPALVNAIVAKIERGYPIDVSCATNDVLSIPYITFGKWCNADAELRNRVDMAILKAEKMCLNPIVVAIESGEKEDARWLLTHRYAHKYHSRVDDVTPSANDPVDPTAELIAAITRRVSNARRGRKRSKR